MEIKKYVIQLAITLIVIAVVFRVTPIKKIIVGE